MSRVLIALCLVIVPVCGLDKARLETRTVEAVRKFGVTGRGVAVAILDRGIDWSNNDFRNADGSTRIDSIFDMTAQSPAGVVYSRTAIDAALREGGIAIPHRDAVGHGTTTAGIAAGNGRNSPDRRYRGYAPNATLVVVKIVAGAAAHDDQAAEPQFVSTANTIPDAINYALGRARQLNMPMVMLPNIGSVGGPMDGTSVRARDIDAKFGPGIQGRVLVTGSSDDGGVDNHAQTSIAQGQTVTLQIEKTDARLLRFEAWYPEADRYDVTIQPPTGAAAGPFASPANNQAADSRTATGISYLHRGSAVTTAGAITKRQILVDFTGPAGRYTVTLRGASATGATFHAWLNNINGGGEFKNFIVPGYTVWDLASARNNICPNDYVLREKWADLDGVVRSIRVDRVGDLWEGSGIGPTPDGRLGIDISAPGNSVFATLAPKSAYGVGRTNKVQDGGGFYTLQNAVSAANPQVTGIVALMLELNPALDATQVKKILQETARRDQYTGPDPNPRWGYGKVDALAALTATSELPGAKPYYSLDRNEISQDYTRGGSVPDPLLVRISPGNGAAEEFTVTTSASWLRPEPGGDPLTVSIVTDPAELANGDYSGEVTITSTSDKAIPQTVLVHLRVRAAGPLITSIEDAGAGGPGFANGSRIVIRGRDLAGITRELRPEDIVDGKFPTTLEGVRVRVFDRDAFPYFVSPEEVRAIAPENPLTNTRFAIGLFRDGRASNGFVANTLPRNPEFFRLKMSQYVDARLESDGSFLGPAGLLGDEVPTRPAMAGEAIRLYGTGCGATDPPVAVDRIAEEGTKAPVTEAASLTIGGKPAKVSFVGAVGSGVCRVDAVVPEGIAESDAEVILRIGSFVSADAVFLKIGR